MRLVTFTYNSLTDEKSEPRAGALVGGGEYILDFNKGIEEGLEQQTAINLLDWFDLEGLLFQKASALYGEVTSGPDQFEAAQKRGAIVARSEVRLLAPVPRPGKIICIGLNYRDHAIESNMPIPTSPVIFSKFTTCVTGPNDSVVLPAKSEKVDYEAELAVVIGRRAKNVSKERALDYVLGYMNFNDVSARDFQFADGQWQRGKSCDTFAPMGEYIATTDEITDPNNLAVKLRLNGQTLQDSSTNQFIFNVSEVVAFLSESITLEPGDVIATGTPPGVGFARNPPVFLKDGDVMEVEIEGLGILTNKVVGTKS